MIMCELTWCRNNSEGKEVHPNTNEGVCRADSILIRDKGYGPTCRNFDEYKECFGKPSTQDVCLRCEDNGDCCDLEKRKLEDSALNANHLPNEAEKK
jgi:hypothetical protein